MAGLTLPPVTLLVPADAALHSIGALVPAAKYESVCLMMTLGGGAADAYADVYLADTGTPANSATIIFNEPVRYRQPGGSPVLLMNFILGPQQQFQLKATVGQLQAVLFNRWQFDA